MASGERQHLLYPGDPITDTETFWELPDRFSAPTAASPEIPSKWEHGNLVTYLMSRTSIDSTAADIIGNVEDTSLFSQKLDYEKRSSTIHLPGSEYALPRWAAHFGDAVLQILTHEHEVNPRADNQVAQLRFRQYGGQPRNTHPHLGMVGSNARNFHFYLATDHSPTTTYDGEFTYEPHPYPQLEEDPLEFFRDLDMQFGRQVGEATARTADPFEIIALSALTVHKPPASMPIGRTLLGVQFYELAETNKAA